ncbi:MAG: 3-dehydroquinate synthase [Lentimonas sp.]|jgi:3-dehydroquinate synthase
MTIEALIVELDERSYPIHFSDSLSTLKEDVATLRSAGHSVYALSDEAVLTAQPELLLQAGFKLEEIFTVPAGEHTKSIEHFSQVISFLAHKSANRDTALFALGGGVIGDLAGYAAASYLRGISFYQIPTTLLAMVDSSVGGKTGINLPEGKNLVGAFWQPKAVYIDTKLLKTLPSREFAAGMAEVIKYGMLYDFTLFEEIERIESLSVASHELASIIRCCCLIKAEIVAEDEKETAISNGRALLNLGHTFAHAIENVAGYGHYLHGEAVAIGLVLATQLSEQLGQLTTADIERVKALLTRFNLPVYLKEPLPIPKLMTAMQRDKKNRRGQFRFVTLRMLGHAVTTENIDEAVIMNLLKTVGAK